LQVPRGDTTGWNAFTTSKKLVVGDVIVFARYNIGSFYISFGSWVLGFKLFTYVFRGETGELRVGIRWARRQQGNIPSSIVSIESMRHGVIASAKHAFDNQCMFIMVYKPR